MSEKKNLNVYWLGGASCAGKSTITKMLAISHGFIQYDGDPGAATRFLMNGSLDHIPNLKRLRETFEAPTSTRWALELPPQDIAELYISWGKGIVPLITEELALNAESSPIIVDCLCGHPSSLQPFAPSERMTFVFADLAFLKKEWKSRRWLHEMIEGDFESYDERRAAYEKYIAAQCLIHDFEIEDCKRNNVPYKITSGNLSLQESYEYVASSFGLSPVNPAKLPEVE